MNYATMEEFLAIFLPLENFINSKFHQACRVEALNEEVRLQAPPYLMVLLFQEFDLKVRNKGGLANAQQYLC